MKMQTVLGWLVGVLGASLVYAMDWNRQQDQRISDLDKITTQQTTILKMQIEYNRELFKGKIIEDYNKKEIVIDKDITQ